MERGLCIASLVVRYESFVMQSAKPYKEKLTLHAMKSCVRSVDGGGSYDECEGYGTAHQAQL